MSAGTTHGLISSYFVLCLIESQPWGADGFGLGAYEKKKKVSVPLSGHPLHT